MNGHLCGLRPFKTVEVECASALRRRLYAVESVSESKT
jgi:hypothetical protein